MVVVTLAQPLSALLPHALERHDRSLIANTPCQSLLYDHTQADSQRVASLTPPFHLRPKFAAATKLQTAYHGWEEGGQKRAINQVRRGSGLDDKDAGARPSLKQKKIHNYRRPLQTRLYFSALVRSMGEFRGELGAG